MILLRVYLGETVLRLGGRHLDASIREQPVSSVELEEDEVEAIWKFLGSISIPIVPDRAAAGVGGRGGGIEISAGMSNLQFRWWMKGPTGWEASSEVFWKLAEYLPLNVRHGYLFGAGGE